MLWRHFHPHSHHSHLYSHLHPHPHRTHFIIGGGSEDVQYHLALLRGLLDSESPSTDRVQLQRSGAVGQGVAREWWRDPSALFPGPVASSEKVCECRASVAFTLFHFTPRSFYGCFDTGFGFVSFHPCLERDGSVLAWKVYHAIV